MTNKPAGWLQSASYLIVNVICASFVILLMILINVQVLLSALGAGIRIPLGFDFPIVGGALTINSFIDAQWHILLVISFFPMGILLLLDRHIRVDVLHSRMGGRLKSVIDVAGHVLIGLPCLILMLPAAWSFFRNALRSGEGSPLGGLQDFYIIKFVLFLGIGVLAIFVIIDALAKLRRVFRGH